MMAWRCASSTRHRAPSVAPMRVGEIQVQGWGVMRGCRKRPEANAKVFQRMAGCTGDLGRCARRTPAPRGPAEGRIPRVGGEENVAPAEVEQALLSHPAVASAQGWWACPTRDWAKCTGRVCHAPSAGMALDAEALLAWPEATHGKFPRAALRRDRDGLYGGGPGEAHRHDRAAARCRRTSCASTPSRCFTRRTHECRAGDVHIAEVVLCECFARDGLQHEPRFLCRPETKSSRSSIDLRNRFPPCGSHVVLRTRRSQKPQFADATDLRCAHRRAAMVAMYKATCATGHAVQRALADLEAGFGATEGEPAGVGLVVALERNLKRSRDDQWQNIRAMADAARGHFRHDRHDLGRIRLPVRGLCRPAGSPARCGRFRDAGVSFVTLGDDDRHGDARDRAGAVPRHAQGLPGGHANCAFPCTTWHRPGQLCLLRWKPG